MEVGFVDCDHCQQASGVTINPDDLTRLDNGNVIDQTCQHCGNTIAVFLTNYQIDWIRDFVKGGEPQCK